jgi:hypothetical protein
MSKEIEWLIMTEYSYLSAVNFDGDKIAGVDFSNQFKNALRLTDSKKLTIIKRHLLQYGETVYVYPTAYADGDKKPA